VVYRSDFCLPWVGKALVSQGVREVLLRQWALDGAPKGGNLFFPFQLTTNQELMPTRGIRLFN